MQAEQRGSQNLDQIQSENTALHTESEALRQRVRDLEQTIAQSGMSLPAHLPPGASPLKGHRAPRTVTPAANATGKRRPPAPKSPPKLSGPNAGRRQTGR